MQLVVALLCGTAVLGLAPEANLSVVLVRSEANATTLDYAVESRIYPEAPELLVVTHRAAAPHASVSIFDMSGDPAAPELRASWAGQSVEGQDRRGDLLVVTALGNRVSNGSRLLFFNCSSTAAGGGLLGGAGLFAALALSFDGALHVKIYAPEGGRVYAIVTSGLTSVAGADRTRVSAVDITEPRAAVEVAHTSTACKCGEGVFVLRGSRDVAFVGSYCGNDVALLDLSQLPVALPQLAHASDPGYENMVSAVRNSSYNTLPQSAPGARKQERLLLFSASYASPGGLVVFDGDAMTANSAGSISEVGRSIEMASSRANRVHLSADGRFALLALEKSPTFANGTTPETGGLAVVDIRDPTAPALLSVVRVPEPTSRAYCLATRMAPSGVGLYVYLFGATAKTMYTYLVSGFALGDGSNHSS